MRRAPDFDARLKRAAFLRFQGYSLQQIAECTRLREDTLSRLFKDIGPYQRREPDGSIVTAARTARPYPGARNLARWQ